jgi:hypothetical protein
MARNAVINHIRKALAAVDDPFAGLFNETRTTLPPAQGPASGQQLLLPFDGLARSVNRGSQRGLLARILKMGAGKYQLKPRPLLPGTQRTFDLTGKDPKTGTPLLVSASKMPRSSKGEKALGRNTRVYSQPSDPNDPPKTLRNEVEIFPHNPKGDARGVFGTLAHELQHSRDASSGRMPHGELGTKDRAKMESRAMLRAVIAERKLLGLDPYRISDIQKQMVGAFFHPEYGLGAKRVIRYLNRMKR